MQFIKRELDRLHGVLTSDKSPERHAELYAAQQALVWAMDAETFKAPHDMLVTYIQADLKDCRVESGHSEFSDNHADHAAGLLPKQICPVR
jgi:hypothetical protein